MTKFSTVILAAGKGTRMYSDLPKVLHKVAGKAMVEHVIDTAESLGSREIHLIYGYKKEVLTKALAHKKLNFVYQDQQLGTAHAMNCAAPFFVDNEDVLMLYGDSPLIKASTLERLIAAKPQDGIALLTVKLADPTGYGRILRNSKGQIIGIKEQKDASPEELLIQEVNTGVMVASGKSFKNWLARVDNNNAQQEYYMTDVIALAHNDGCEVVSVMATDSLEVEGANNRVQLAALERYYQQQQATELLTQGVSIIDPKRFDLRGNLECGRDVSIDINCVFEGVVKLGNNVSVGAGSVLKNATIGDNVTIKPYSIIEDSTVGSESLIGPFARLRPQSELGEQVHIGNFVELKKTKVAAKSKINHLSYVGDTLVGSGCNIGAGVITCNYDGVNKHQTIIGNGVFVGSDVQLVAPVKLADNCIIGAGSTITKDVAENALALSRNRQTEIADYKKRKNKK